MAEYPAAVATKAALLAVAATVTAAGALVVNKHNPVDATAAPLTMTLPTGQPQGSIIIAEKYDSTTNAVTISGSIRGVGASTDVLVLPHQTTMFEADAAGSWWPVASHKPLVALDGRYIQPSQHGEWFMDSYTGTDDQKMASALAAFAASTAGGTIILPPRACTFANQWTTAYAAGVPKALRIVGPGFAPSGVWGVTASPCTIDHQWNGSGTAKLDFQHIGLIELTGFQLQDTAGDNKPFVLTTNAMPYFHDLGVVGSKSGVSCDQDAFILGGTSTAIGAGDDAPFQGYGGVITRCYFSHVRRTVVGQAYCNNVNVKDNTVSTTCGNSAGGCIEFNGNATAGTTNGNVVTGNTIEVMYYQYGLACDYASDNTFGPNGFYDPTATNLGCYSFGDHATYNMVVDGFRNDTKPLVIETAVSTTTNSQITAHQGQTTIFTQPVRFTSTMQVFGNTGAISASSGGDQGYWGVFQGATPYPQMQVTAVPGTQVLDGTTTNGSNVVGSATAAWTSADVGAAIKGTGIPTQTFITKVISGSSVQISKNATATGSALQINWGRLGTLMGMTIFERHHIRSTGTAPSAAADVAQAGTGATATITGTDLAGTLTLVTGTGAIAGLLCHWSWNINYTAAPRIALFPKNAAAAALVAGGLFATTTTSANNQLTSVGVPVSSATAIFDYVAVQ